MLLSKTDFLIGRQCDRRLWLRKNSDDPEPSVSSEDVSELLERAGRDVETLVEELYRRSGRAAPRRGQGVPELSLPDAHARDFAVFQHRIEAGGLVAVIDVLEPRDRGWYLWEIKASTSAKAMHYHDLAFQVEAARRAGIPVAGAGLWLLDSEEVRGEELDLEAFLSWQDVGDEVAALRDATAEEIARQQRLLSTEEVPSAVCGPRCKEGRSAAAGDRPSTCGHLAAEGFCGRDLPPNWVGRLCDFHGPKKQELCAAPDTTVEGLDPADPRFARETTRRMIRSVREGRAEIDPESLRRELDRLEWPVTYVDFEFDSLAAVPRFPGAWAFAKSPFQWAMYRQSEPGGPLDEPEPFLWLNTDDPRAAFAESLLAAVPAGGSIVVHYRGAEEGVISELARFLGGETARRLEALLPRLYDTIDLLKAGYYHPAQQGSYSIKKVAPAILGRGYEDLELQDGLAAVVAWKVAIDPDTPSQERDRLAAHLKEYCGRDTILMHEIIDAVRALIS